MLERSNLPYIAPFAAYVLFMFIEDVLLKLGWNADDVRMLYAIKITAVVVLLWIMRNTYSELYSFANVTIKTSMTAVVAGIVVFVAWINLTAEWMVMGDAIGFDPRNDEQIDWVLVAIRLFGAALVVPIMEELFWRSFLMRWIENQNFRSVVPGQIGFKAFFIMAALFAVAHSLWFAGFFVGIVYGLLYMRSGTLWSPILAHAVTNGLLGIWIVMTGNWGFW